jgi:hypothetical protein
MLDHILLDGVDDGQHSVSFSSLKCVSSARSLFNSVCLIDPCVGLSCSSFDCFLDAEDTRLAVLIVYFMGKFASRGGFVVILQYTCEIFPTGLR